MIIKITTKIYFGSILEDTKYSDDQFQIRLDPKVILNPILYKRLNM